LGIINRTTKTNNGKHFTMRSYETIPYRNSFLRYELCYFLRYFDMITLSVARDWLGKHVSAAKDTHATMCWRGPGAIQQSAREPIVVNHGSEAVSH
jgi:hypothetical protein